jgi:hypothetical protein
MIKSLTVLLALASVAVASSVEVKPRCEEHAKKIGYFWAAPGNASLNSKCLLIEQQEHC